MYVLCLIQNPALENVAVLVIHLFNDWLENTDVKNDEQFNGWESYRKYKEVLFCISKRILWTSKVKFRHFCICLRLATFWLFECKRGPFKKCAFQNSDKVNQHFLVWRSQTFQNRDVTRCSRSLFSKWDANSCVLSLSCVEIHSTRTPLLNNTDTKISFSVVCLRVTRAVYACALLHNPMSRAHAVIHLPNWFFGCARAAEIGKWCAPSRADFYPSEQIIRELGREQRAKTQ